MGLTVARKGAEGCDAASADACEGRWIDPALGARRIGFAHNGDDKVSTLCTKSGPIAEGARCF